MKVIFKFEGLVVEGKKRGRLLGFPTANIILESNIPEGIYAAKASARKKEYLAAVFIGKPKTFNENDYKAEAYLLDFSEELYNETLRIDLYHKIRDNRKFQSSDELVDQMKKDIKEVTRYFQVHI